MVDSGNSQPWLLGFTAWLEKDRSGFHIKTYILEYVSDQPRPNLRELKTFKFTNHQKNQTFLEFMSHTTALFIYILHLHNLNKARGGRVPWRLPHALRQVTVHETLLQMNGTRVANHCVVALDHLKQGHALGQVLKRIHFQTEDLAKQFKDQQSELYTSLGEVIPSVSVDLFDMSVVTCTATGLEPNWDDSTCVGECALDISKLLRETMLRGIVHRDLRKANIAFFPAHGFRLIDWTTAIKMEKGTSISVDQFPMTDFKVNDDIKIYADYGCEVDVKCFCHLFGNLEHAPDWVKAVCDNESIQDADQLHGKKFFFSRSDEF